MSLHLLDGIISAIVDLVREHRRTHPRIGPIVRVECYDAMKALAAKAKTVPEATDWNKGSIVDLEKVLGRDSSFDARRELWDWTYGDSIKYTGSAEQNTKLYDHVMQQVQDREIIP